MDYSKVIDLIQNKDLEQEVLGSIMKEESLFDAIETCSKDIFYNTMHQNIFEAMKKLKNQGQAIDLITVCKVANETYDTPVSYIAELTDTVATTATYETHIKLLMDYKNKRDILKTIQSIDFTNSSEAIGNEIYKLLDKILVTQKEDKDTKEALFDYIGKLYEPNKESGIKLGLNTIDNQIGGLLPGQLLTIAGYTGMGKSIVTTQIILNMLMTNKKVVLYSLEMSREEIFNKMVSNGCNIEFNNIFTNNITDQEKDKITKYISMFLLSKDLVIYEFVDDINKIETQIKKDKLQNKADIIFIDLINRVTDRTTKEQNRAVFLSGITRKLKLIAGKLKIPIVITAQINRAVESRRDKAPTLADIKESGGIAEDSDYVFGLYRNKDLEDEDVRRELSNTGKLNYSSKNAEFNPKCIEIHVLKGRNIQGFKAGFYWLPEYQRVANMEV